MNLLRAAATISGLTLLSRVTGLVRENLTASIFGVSAFTDAFFVAFRLPNLLRPGRYHGTRSGPYLRAPGISPL